MLAATASGICSTCRGVPVREIEDREAIKTLIRLIPDGVYRELRVRRDVDV